jgi:ribosome biogenesis protein MAK21
LAAEVADVLKGLNLSRLDANDSNKPKDAKNKSNQSTKYGKEPNQTPKAAGKQKQKQTSKPADKQKQRQKQQPAKPEPKGKDPETKQSISLADIVPSKQSTARSKARLIVPPTPQWYTLLPPPSLPPAQPIPSALLSTLTQKAQSLHNADTTAYQSSSTSSNSETLFFSKIVSSGTLSDRLSALTLLVQNSPVHNTKALEQLRAIAARGKGQGGRGDSLKALRCIVDWWVGGGVPDRKLKSVLSNNLCSPN